MRRVSGVHIHCNIAFSVSGGLRAQEGKSYNVKAAVGLGCSVNRQRPERGLTLVQEFLSASRTLSFALVLYVVNWTEH
jgi:hypothetical protein